VGISGLNYFTLGISAAAWAEDRSANIINHACFCSHLRYTYGTAPAEEDEEEGRRNGNIAPMGVTVLGGITSETPNANISRIT
jgi:hypothetical protein